MTCCLIKFSAVNEKLTPQTYSYTVVLFVKQHPRYSMDCQMYLMKSEYAKSFFNPVYWHQKKIWITHFKRFLKGEITRDDLDKRLIYCLNPHWTKIWEEELVLFSVEISVQKISVPKISVPKNFSSKKFQFKNFSSKISVQKNFSLKLNIFLFSQKLIQEWMDEDEDSAM